MLGAVLDSLENRGYNQLYLPAISFGALLLKSNGSDFQFSLFGISVGFFFAGFLATLFSGALFKQFLKAASGPITEEPNPVNSAEIAQRVGYTIGNRGKPSQYPTGITPLWEADVEIPRHRYLLLLVVFVSMATVVISFLFTTWEVSRQALVQRDIILGAIGFLQLVIGAQLLSSALWPDTYLEYAYKSPTLIDRMEELYSYYQINSNLTIEGGTFDTDDGGIASFTFSTSDSADDPTKAIEFLLLGISGTIVPDDFPCRTFRFRYQLEEKTYEYEINSGLVEGFCENHITMEELVNKTMDNPNVITNLS